MVIRPEHLEIDEAPDGDARGDTWRIVRRRFAGSEILLEVEARDGLRVWCEAGPHVRRLRLGDSVSIRLRDAETVAFPPTRGTRAPAGEPGADAPAGSPTAIDIEPSDEAGLPAPTEIPGA